jgi:hypothetical protein
VTKLLEGLPQKERELVLDELKKVKEDRDQDHEEIERMFERDGE